MKIGFICQKEINSLDLKIAGTHYFELNSIVKNALLITLAGYLEKDNIIVSGEKYYQPEKLSRFFSYVLNDKRAAPRKFKVKIRFIKDLFESPPVIKNNFDYIIAFSGGIDSTAGILYALDRGYVVKPIWLGFGQKNESHELKVIKKICTQLNLDPLIIKIDLKKYVDEGWSRWKMGIIPARNYLFAAIASSIAARSTKKKVIIYICAHKEEIYPESTDKSHRFFDTSTAIFREAYQKNINVTTPFYGFTKPEIISYWVHHWKKKYKFSPHDTSSCYFGNNCGVCKACINRAIAFSCAGIDTENFRVNPFLDTNKTIQTDYLRRFDSLILERKLDFLYALNKNKKLLPKSIKDFLHVKLPVFTKRIRQRQEKIANVNID